MREASTLVALMLVAAACAGGEPGNEGATAPSSPASSTTIVSSAKVDSLGEPIPPPPEVPDGPLAPGVITDLDLVFADVGRSIDVEALTRLGDSGDARIAWLLADLLRFAQRGPIAEAARGSFEHLTGTEVGGAFAWGQVTDRLIAWVSPPHPVTWVGSGHCSNSSSRHGHGSSPTRMRMSIGAGCRGAAC